MGNNGSIINGGNGDGRERERAGAVTGEIVEQQLGFMNLLGFTAQALSK
jgi:hypothetical protein